MWEREKINSWEKLKQTVSYYNFKNGENIIFHWAYKMASVFDITLTALFLLTSNLVNADYVGNRDYIIKF